MALEYYCDVYDVMSMISLSGTHVSEVEGDLEVLGELLGELRVHLEDVQQVVAVDLMQVAVRQRTHAARGLADRRVQAHVLPEHIVLT